LISFTLPMKKWTLERGKSSHEWVSASNA